VDKVNYSKDTMNYKDNKIISRNDNLSMSNKDKYKLNVNNRFRHLERPFYFGEGEIRRVRLKVRKFGVDVLIWLVLFIVLYRLFIICFIGLIIFVRIDLIIVFSSVSFFFFNVIIFIFVKVRRFIFFSSL